jgi:tetratricopeptide (TPR) repeat protein
MKNLITILVANLLLLSCTAQKTPLELNPAFDPIRTSTLNERYEKALRDLAGMPNSAEKFAVDGFNYLEWAIDGKFIDATKTAEAKEAFLAGVKADSLFPLNYIGLGQVEMREGNGGKADTYFAKARGIVDNKKNKATKDLKYTTYIAIAAANIAENAKNLGAAKQTLDALAEVVIENTAIRLQLGLTLGDYQSFKEVNNQSPAISEYNKCLEIDSKYVPALYRKAKLYRGAKNNDEALKFFNEAIATDPTFAPSYREKAELLKDRGQFEEAIAAYAKYLELNNSCRVQQRYASFFYLTKNFDRAITEVTAAIPCNPENYTLNRVLGYSYLELKNFQDAKNYMDIYFSKQEVKNQDVSDYVNYSKICLGLGQDSLSIVYLEKAIELFPEYTDGYNEIATIYTNKAIASKGKENEALRIKLYGQAANWYEKKMVKLGADAKDQFIQGQMYYFSQQYVLADTTFRRSSVRYPEAWFWVAKSQNKIDLATVTETSPAKGLAKPFYEKGIILVGLDPAIIEKNKKNLAEAYQYLGLYYGNMGDINCSKSAWNKVLQLDPTNKIANQLLVTPETLDQELLAAPGDCALVVYPEVPKESTEGTEGN